MFKRRRQQLEIHVSDEKKQVEVWLTRQEQDDVAVQEELKPMYQDYKRRGYLVAVFQSGKQDLYRQTSDLLLYNRKRIQELAVRREKDNPSMEKNSAKMFVGSVVTEPPTQEPRTTDRPRNALTPAARRRLTF